MAVVTPKQLVRPWVLLLSVGDPENWGWLEVGKLALIMVARLRTHAHTLTLVENDTWHNRGTVTPDPTPFDRLTSCRRSEKGRRGSWQMVDVEGLWAKANSEGWKLEMRVLVACSCYSLLVTRYSLLELVNSTIFSIYYLRLTCTRYT